MISPDAVRVSGNQIWQAMIPNLAVRYPPLKRRISSGLQETADCFPQSDMSPIAALHQAAMRGADSVLESDLDQGADWFNAKRYFSSRSRSQVGLSYASENEHQRKLKHVFT